MCTMDSGQRGRKKEVDAVVLTSTGVCTALHSALALLDAHCTWGRSALQLRRGLPANLAYPRHGASARAGVGVGGGGVIT
jgi:hypothetical protein